MGAEAKDTDRTARGLARRHRDRDGSAALTEDILTTQHLSESGAGGKAQTRELGALGAVTTEIEAAGPCHSRDPLRLTPAEGRTHRCASLRSSRPLTHALRAPTPRLPKWKPNDCPVNKQSKRTEERPRALKGCPHGAGSLPGLGVAVSSGNAWR